MNDKMGGPAFPGRFEVQNTFGEGYTEYFSGMTLWDVYAAAALSGMLANPIFQDAHEKSFAQGAALFADTMLAERKKKMEQSDD